MTANNFKLENMQPVPQIPDVLPPCDTQSAHTPAYLSS